MLPPHRRPGRPRGGGARRREREGGRSEAERSGECAEEGMLLARWWWWWCAMRVECDAEVAIGVREGGKKIEKKEKVRSRVGFGATRCLCAPACC